MTERGGQLDAVTAVGVEFVDIGENTDEGCLLDECGHPADGKAQSERAERPIFFKSKTGADHKTGSNEDEAGNKEPGGDRVPLQSKYGEENEGEARNNGDDAPDLRHGRTGAELRCADAEKNCRSKPDESDEKVDEREIGVEDQSNEEQGEERGDKVESAARESDRATTSEIKPKDRENEDEGNRDGEGPPLVMPVGVKPEK